MTSRIERVMVQLRCTESDAQHYMDLRDDGHSHYAATVMAGLADPYDDSESVDELPVTPEEEEAFNSMRGELR